MPAHKVFIMGFVSGVLVGILIISLMAMNKVAELRVAMAGLTATIVMANTP